MGRNCWDQADQNQFNECLRVASSAFKNLAFLATNRNRVLQLGLVGALVSLGCLDFAWSAPRANDHPLNKPKEIVEALLGRDFNGLARYTGGNEYFEYMPIFESYPPYRTELVKNSSGVLVARDVAPTFGNCTQEMLVKSIKVTKVQAGPNLTTSLKKPSLNVHEAYVTVEAEVLALRLYHQEKIPGDQRCSWLGLEVKNTKTGKRESYLDSADDGATLLKMMKQFGTLNGDYLVVDPHRRQWSYGIHLLLPVSGKGQHRHYDKEKRQYIDAVQPRWLIQDPYPPQAIAIQAALNEVKSKLNHAQAQAQTACRNAIRDQLLKIPKSVDLSHPACVHDVSVLAKSKNIKIFEVRLKMLTNLNRL